MRPISDSLKTKHQIANNMFERGQSLCEVVETLHISKHLAQKWKAGFKKLQNVNLKQRFARDFESGQFSINELARRYGMDRRKLLKWKRELFGLGSLKQKRMYQMHLAGIPAHAIAEFYKTQLPQVHLSIRKHKAKETAFTKKRLTEAIELVGGM